MEEIKAIDKDIAAKQCLLKQQKTTYESKHHRFEGFLKDNEEKSVTYKMLFEKECT